MQCMVHNRAIVARFRARVGRAEASVIVLTVLAIVAAALITGAQSGHPAPVGETLAPVVSFDLIVPDPACVRAIKSVDDGKLPPWSVGTYFTARTDAVITTLPSAPRALLGSLRHAVKAAGCTLTTHPIARSTSQLDALTQPIFVQSLAGRSGRVVDVGVDPATDRLRVGLSMITTGDRRDLYRRFGDAVEVAHERPTAFLSGAAS
jgi:hypothetical protein